MRSIKENQKFIGMYLLLAWIILPWSPEVGGYPIPVWGLYLLLLIGCMQGIRERKAIPLKGSFLPIVFGMGMFSLISGYPEGGSPGDVGILLVMCSVLYWIWKDGPVIGRGLLRVHLLVGSLVNLLILLQQIGGIHFYLGGEVFYTDMVTLSSFALLQVVLAGCLYVEEGGKCRYLYFTAALTGMEVLFILGERGFILSGGAVFLTFPLLYRPSKETLQKSAELVFAYFFLLANQSLLGYFPPMDFLKAKYSLEESVYLEMLLAVAGLVFFHYWDKIEQRGEEALRDFKRLFGMATIGYGAWLFAEMYTQDGGGIPKEMGYTQAVLHYGLLGTVVFFGFWAYTGYRLYHYYMRRKAVIPVSGVVTLVFLMQVLMEPVVMETMPIYLLFVEQVWRKRKKALREKKNEEK